MSLYFDPVLGFILLLLELQDSDTEENVPTHRGLTNQQMQRIRIIDRSSIQNSERCTICMEGFSEQPTSVLRQLECGHNYHEHCLFEWLQLQNTCPLCRFSLANFQGARNVGSENESRLNQNAASVQNSSNLNALSNPNTQNTHLQANTNEIVGVDGVVRRNPRRSVRRDINYRETLRYHRN